MALKRYNDLSDRYNQIEQDIQAALKAEIEASTNESEHVDSKCIYPMVYDYEELVIIDDELVFLDANGYHFDLYSECTNDDLLGILNNL